MNAGKAANRIMELEEALAAKDAELARMKAVVADAGVLLRQWRPIGWMDHACAQCLPDGPIVVDGFRCAFHTAISPAPEVGK